MGLADVFSSEDRTTLTVSQFESILKRGCERDLLMNAINTEVPYRYIREMVTGVKEEVKETPGTLEDSEKTSKSTSKVKPYEPTNPRFTPLHVGDSVKFHPVIDQVSTNGPDDLSRIALKHSNETFTILKVCNYQTAPGPSVTLYSYVISVDGNSVEFPGYMFDPVKGGEDDEG